jgi:hypothetical protein
MNLRQPIGGNSGGDPSKTEFPTRYEIDYVHVYQRTGDSKADNAKGDGTKPEAEK